MIVTVNGEDRDVPTGASVADLVAQLGSSPRGIAVVVGGAVVPRGEWGGRPLTEGESIEVISAVQGG